jgi:hypothetical protein
MAKPLTAAQIRAAHVKWGCPFVEVAGWETRSNKSGWGTSGRITGTMYHHTASDASDLTNRNLVRDGHATLDGPLCNFGVRDDGKIEFIAAGAANHAGGGDPQTLALVQKELTPLDREVKPDQNSSSAGAVNGNPAFYGYESYYGIGKDPTPNTLQHRATILSMTAIIDALDTIDTANVWTGRAAIGHREWTNRKIDPSAVKMHEVRVTINALRKAGPKLAAQWYKTGSMTPIVTTPEAPVADPIPRVYRGTAAAQDVVKAFLTSDVFHAPDRSTTNPYWGFDAWTKYIGYYSRDTLVELRLLDKKVVALQGDIDDLTSQVSQLTALVTRLVEAHAPETPEVTQP